MPQHLADLRQRQALPQHVHGKRMAQLMRPGDLQLDPGAVDRAVDDLADVAVRAQAIEGRPRAQEQPATRRFRPPALQIGCDRLAHIMGQRHRPFLAAFAMHPQPTLRPVDILQLEADDFQRAQPKPRQQQQDGSITQPRWRAPRLACVQKSANALGRHRPGDRRHRPSRDAGDRRGQVDLDIVAVAREPEERPQRGHHVLRRGERPPLRRVSPDIVGDVRTPNGRKPKIARPADACQESPDHAGVAGDGRGRQTTVLLQVGSVLLQNLVDLGCFGRRQCLARDDAIGLKPGPYIVQREPLVPLPRLRAMTMGRVTKKPLLVFRLDLASRNTLLPQPPAEVTDEEGLLPIGDLRISTAREIFRIGFEVRRQWPFNFKLSRSLSTCSAHRPKLKRPTPVR